MKDVIFIIPALKGGGAEKSVINLCRALEVEQGYKTHLLVLNDIIDYDVDGIRVHNLNIKDVSKKGIKRLTYRKEVSRKIDDYIIKNFSKDVPVFSNMVFSDKIMSQSKLNVFHIIRNAYSGSMLKNKGRLRQFFIRRNISKVYSNHPLIFIADGTRQDFEDNFSSRQEKYVIHNAIDIEYVKKMSKDYEVEGEYILHVGRLNRMKRHDWLLNAYSKSNKDLKLFLLGKGELEGEIKSNIRNLGLSDSVELLPFNKNPYPLIKNAKLVLLTSEYEGLCRVMMEASILDTPIVSFDCPGGIRESVTNPNSLVSLGDIDGFATKIDEALKYPEHYINDFPKDFTYQTVAKKFRDLIEG